jgi:hypothetical protein
VILAVDLFQIVAVLHKELDAEQRLLAFETRETPGDRET